MNQKIAPTIAKRVPKQYHLTLHTQPTYQGLSVLNCQGGFVREYLDRLYCTIHRAAQRYSRVFAVRLDLHFPQYYSSIEQENLSNEYLHTFIRSLRCQLKKYSSQKKRLGQRVHDVSFEYVWARECGADSRKPHFHLLLLFNGHAFNTLGQFTADYESLYNRIGEAWGGALGLHVSEGGKFVHFPDIGQYMIQAGNMDQLAEVFHRASYLTKVSTKNFHDGFHVFGGSRV